ncbi:hypothetical protein BKA80DRAFT_26139 [Phyllosticta citrichinensis]
MHWSTLSSRRRLAAVSKSSIQQRQRRKESDRLARLCWSRDRAPTTTTFSSMLLHEPCWTAPTRTKTDVQQAAWLVDWPAGIECQRKQGRRRAALVSHSETRSRP